MWKENKQITISQDVIFDKKFMSPKKIITIEDVI